MKKTILTFIAAVIPLILEAQVGIDRLYFDMRGSFHQEVTDGNYESQFKGDYLNLNIFGHIGEKIDYRVRQQFSKKVFEENNMFNGTDFLYINWQATRRWNFLFGKHAVLIGGYEFDAVPIDVYYYSQFCNNIYQGFTFGASAGYEFARNQRFVAQICNSPLSLGLSTIFAYNIGWTGEFAPWWKTLWTVNFVEDSSRRMINYISLGNHLQYGGLLFDLDFMNRAGLTQKRFFFSDITLISKIIWSVGKWNICAKAGYETNSSENVDKDGLAYDVVIAPGTEYVYYGCGLEWFPLGRDNLRLHAVYYRDNASHKNNFDLGVTWRVDIIPMKRATR